MVGKTPGAKLIRRFSACTPDCFIRIPVCIERMVKRPISDSDLWITRKSSPAHSSKIFDYGGSNYARTDCKAGSWA